LPDQPRVPDIRLGEALPARIWNALGGGKDHFAPDREAAKLSEAAMPSLPLIARYVRRFQVDAVTRLAGMGVRQFVDIGTGLPADGSVHEVAQRIAPESRVVYVDNDPLVLTHARALLTSSPEGACAYLDADLAEPGKILALAGQTLDLSRPVAVLLIAVLHFIADAGDPWAITGRLLAGITGDAYLAVAHAASDLGPAQAAAMATEYNSRSAVPITVRPYEQVARFYTGTQLLAPGIVPLTQWVPPLDGEPVPSHGGHCYVGIGRRPGGPAVP
jgi:hypothetical protein